MNGWYLLKVYKKVFEREAGESDPEIWALATSPSCVRRGKG
jgi:hypothetical protein